MLVELTRDQVAELADVVRERLGELSGEIHHARVSEFSDALKLRKLQLQQILESLRHAIPAE